MQVYQLRVTTRAALANASQALAAREPPLGYATGLPPFPPTWGALRLYFQAVFAEASLQLPDAALELLQYSTFPELTGCPALCTFVPTDFPSKNQVRQGQASPLRPGGGAVQQEMWRFRRWPDRSCASPPPACCMQMVPVVTAGPGKDGACPPAPEGALPVPPDSVDETSQLCAADWLQALVS